jgi:hypothetical protein
VRGHLIHTCGLSRCRRRCETARIRKAQKHSHDHHRPDTGTTTILGRQAQLPFMRKVASQPLKEEQLLIKTNVQFLFDTVQNQLQNASLASTCGAGIESSALADMQPSHCLFLILQTSQDIGRSRLMSSSWFLLLLFRVDVHASSKALFLLINYLTYSSC